MATDEMTTRSVSAQLSAVQARVQHRTHTHMNQINEPNKDITPKECWTSVLDLSHSLASFSNKTSAPPPLTSLYNARSCLFQPLSVSCSSAITAYCLFFSSSCLLVCSSARLLIFSSSRLLVYSTSTVLLYSPCRSSSRR
jgi:hypothetical protein